jgi:tetrahydromethanopterin S-methyltransferase subunit B
MFMKMQQKLIAAGPGTKHKKAVAEIERRIAELEGILAKMKNSPMPCMTGMGSMQGMPCTTGQPCPVTNKPCPNIPQPAAK